MSVIETIQRLRRDDSDFITPPTIRAYTGCTIEQARAGIIEEFGREWLRRQDLSRRHAAMKRMRAIAQELVDEGIAEPDDVIGDVAAWEVGDA